MPMAEFTFFEFHMHGDVKSSGSGGSGMLPFGSGSKSQSHDSGLQSKGGSSGGAHIDIEPESQSQEGGSRGMQVLIGLGLLVGIAAAARVLRGDSEEQAELEEFEEVTPEP